jgi:hypothetical protein
MSEDEREILVDPCPVCDGAHRFRARIIRTQVHHLRTADRVDPKPFGVTRLFTCPATSEMFEGSVPVDPVFGTKVKDVVVRGDD